MAKKLTNEDILKNWKSVNDYLRTAKDEKRVWTLLQTEQRNKARHQVLFRIYGKASKLRMHRERVMMFGK